MEVSGHLIRGAVRRSVGPIVIVARYWIVNIFLVLGRVGCLLFSVHNHIQRAGYNKVLITSGDKVRMCNTHCVHGRIFSNS